MSVHRVQFARRLDLRLGSLAADGKIRGMPLTPVGSHVLQPKDVVPDDPPGIVLDGHVGEIGRQGGNGLGRQSA